MGDQYYNLPMVRENAVSRNMKKIFQGFFNRKRKKRDQRRAQLLEERSKLSQTEDFFVENENIEHQKVDIYEFQKMYLRGEIPAENMNEDQKYALIKLFEMQNVELKKAIEAHRKNTELYTIDTENIKREINILS